MKSLGLVLITILAASIFSFAQGNAFSFQGRLNDGTNPANGRYDLEFKLFDAVAGGTQIGPTVPRPNTILINGVFSVVLDFGAAAFQNPNSIFIEIAIKPFGSPNQLTILGPRQQLTVVPYASRAQNATNADNSQNSAQLGGIAANQYITRTNGGADFIRNSTQTQPTSNFNISGNGTINGNLSVGGNQSLVGSQTVAGNSNLGAINTSGNITQARTPFGAPKAMIYAQKQFIERCFNGITGATTGNCGFTVTAASGLTSVYKVDFGFSINDRFVLITAEYNSSSLQNQAKNYGANFRFFNSTTIDVFLFASGESNDTAPWGANYMIIVY